MKTRMTLVCSCVVLLCAVSSVSADLINIDIDGQGPDDAAVTYSGAAAIGAAGDVWNGYLVDCSGGIPATPPLSSFLNYADGTTSTAKFQLSSVGGVNADQLISTSNDLVDDFCYAAPDGPSIAFSIEGLTPNAQYDLYLYGARYWSPYQTVFTIGATSLTCAGDVFDGTFTETRDYVVFSGIQASASGVIAGIAAATSVAGAYAEFNGVQIMSVPEPNACLLLGMSLAGMLAYAWRRRK